MSEGNDTFFNNPSSPLLFDDYRDGEGFDTGGEILPEDFEKEFFANSPNFDGMESIERMVSMEGSDEFPTLEPSISSINGGADLKGANENNSNVIFAGNGDEQLQASGFQGNFGSANSGHGDGQPLYSSQGVQVINGDYSATFDSKISSMSSAAITLASMPPPPVPQSAIIMQKYIPPAPVPSAGVHRSPNNVLMPPYMNGLPYFKGVPQAPVPKACYGVAQDGMMARSVSLPSMSMPPLSPNSRRGGLTSSPDRPPREQGLSQSPENGSRSRGAKAQSKGLVSHIPRKLTPIAPNPHQHLPGSGIRQAHSQPVTLALPPLQANGIHGYGPNLNLPQGEVASLRRMAPSPLPSVSSPGPSQYVQLQTGRVENMSAAELGNSMSASFQEIASQAPVGGPGENTNGGQHLGMEIFMPSAGLVHRAGVAAEAAAPQSIPQMDASGDGLRPLPVSGPSPLRPSLMQRSLSSHALGQLRHIAPAPPAIEGGGLGYPRISPLDPSRHLPGLGPRLKPQMSDLQSMNVRPILPAIGGMRRVQSTGDIQTLSGLHTRGLHGISPSPFEEGSFKIGRYTAEERRLRITRYRQKRSERNFNKKIKYACRKTLADSRPRVRGRFAKNDDEGDMLMEEDIVEDELLMEEDSSGDFSELLSGIFPNRPVEYSMAPVKLEEPAVSY